MHHSRKSNSRPSLQGGGKPPGSHTSASILASVDGKTGRQRVAANKQAAVASVTGKQRIWLWIVPLVLGGMLAGGAVLWLHQPAAQVASASLDSDRSAGQAVLADTNAMNVPTDAGQESPQVPEPNPGQSQGAYIEDASTSSAAGESPFRALQAKADAPVETASPFQALRETAKPAVQGRLPASHMAQAGAGGRESVPVHTLSKSARAPAVAMAADPAPAASARSATVVARAEPVSRRAMPAAAVAHKGAAVAAVASAPVSASVRSQPESPAAANMVAVVKPAVATLAASAAQAAASAAVAEVPTALGSQDPLNGLLKAASNAAAVATAQGVSHLTRAEAPQASAAGRSGTGAAEVSPAQNASADARKAAEAESAPSANRSQSGGTAENVKVKNNKPNGKPEKLNPSDPDVTLMRALMRHIETTSK